VGHMGRQIDGMGRNRSKVAATTSAALRAMPWTRPRLTKGRSVAYGDNDNKIHHMLGHMSGVQERVLLEMQQMRNEVQQHVADDVAHFDGINKALQDLKQTITYARGAFWVIVVLSSTITTMGVLVFGAVVNWWLGS